MAKGGKHEIHSFYCCKCGQKNLDLPRPKNKQRESLHLKKLYCFHCHDDVNCCEVTNREELGKFLLEFNYHNYDENGNRILPFGPFKDKLLKEGVDIYQYE